MARLGYRPYKEAVLEGTGIRFPQITLFPIDAIARDWNDAQERFFAENGILDVVMKPR